MSEHSPGPDAVVVGPWAGSAATPQPVRHAPQRRRYIPRRVHTDKWGHRVLIYCRECTTPWAPGVDIPDDLLCARCRPLAAEDDPDTPALIPRSDLR